MPEDGTSLPSKRVLDLDLARGIAVALMILSHGIKGLVGFDQFPEWGIVPIHLITKFSSTLFFIVFGASLAVAFLPHIGTLEWPKKRKKLILRGLKIFFWYKVLTIVEMFHLYTREDILHTLFYQAFTVYVEILGFYSLALLWVPFTLRLWRSLPLPAQMLLPFGLMICSNLIYNNFSFWGMEGVQALLVEHKNHYTWGQLARSPLIFLGLLIGKLTFSSDLPVTEKKKAILDVALSSVVFFAGFLILSYGHLYQALHEIALNEGKHPPEAKFMLFSMGGAMFILALTFWGGEKLALVLKPITIIGKDSLHAFIFHIFVIFIFYRYLFNLWHKISYNQALALTLVLLVLTPCWIRIKNWILRES